MLYRTQNFSCNLVSKKCKLTIKTEYLCLLYYLSCSEMVAGFYMLLCCPFKVPILLFLDMPFCVFVISLFLQMDSTALQYENQKLVQQLEVQKSEMHALEHKFKELSDDQCSYDKTLISLNKLWNQVPSFASDMKISVWTFSTPACFSLWLCIL